MLRAGHALCRDEALRVGGPLAALATATASARSLEVQLQPERLAHARQLARQEVAVARVVAVAQAVFALQRAHQRVDGQRQPLTLDHRVLEVHGVCSGVSGRGSE